MKPKLSVTGDASRLTRALADRCIHYGWSVAEISAAVAIRFLLFGAVGPFAAAFLSRFGVTRSLYATYLPAFYLAGAICLAAAIAVFAIQKSTTVNQPRMA